MVTKVNNKVTEGNKRAAFRVPAELHKRLCVIAEQEAKVTKYPVTIAAVARKCMELGLAQMERAK